MSHNITVLARIMILAALALGVLGKFRRLSRDDRRALLRVVVGGGVIILVVLCLIPCMLLVLFGITVLPRFAVGFALAGLLTLVVVSAIYLRRSFSRRGADVSIDEQEKPQ